MNGDTLTIDPSSMLDITGSADPSLVTTGDVFNSTGPLDVADPFAVSDLTNTVPAPLGDTTTIGSLTVPGVAYGAMGSPTGVSDVSAGISTPSNPTPQPGLFTSLNPVANFFSSAIQPFTGTKLSAGDVTRTAQQVTPVAQMLSMLGVNAKPIRIPAGVNPAKAKAGAFLTRTGYFQPVAQKPNAPSNMMPILIGVGLVVLLVMFFRR